MGWCDEVSQENIGWSEDGVPRTVENGVSSMSENEKKRYTFGDGIRVGVGVRVRVRVKLRVEVTPLMEMRME